MRTPVFSTATFAQDGGASVSRVVAGGRRNQGSRSLLPRRGMGAARDMEDEVPRTSRAAGMSTRGRGIIRVAVER